MQSHCPKVFKIYGEESLGLQEGSGPSEVPLNANVLDSKVDPQVMKNILKHIL